jgi:hypothetical protein
LLANRADRSSVEFTDRTGLQTPPASPCDKDAAGAPHRGRAIVSCRYARADPPHRHVKLPLQAAAQEEGESSPARPDHRHSEARPPPTAASVPEPKSSVVTTTGRKQLKLMREQRALAAGADVDRETRARVRAFLKRVVRAAW